jgi:hypothetical protein
MGFEMPHTPEHKIEEAREHLHAAKDKFTSATQDKVAEKVEEAGEKIKEIIDELIEKVKPEKD